MPIDVYMTQLSPTMMEGKIVRWLKKEGDELISGEVMAEIETDKATMEMEVVDEGVLHKIIQQKGSVVPVGSPIAIIAEEDEKVPENYMPEGVAETLKPDTTVEKESPVATPEQVIETLATSQNISGDKHDTEHEPSLKPAGVFNTNGEYDVVVIGAGPGGYVAAIRAAQLGLKTACIESTHLGGICLNWGCIPTKALLRTAELINVINHQGKELGLGIDAAKPDIAQATSRSRNIADKLNKGIGFLFKKNKVAHIEGVAHFAAGNKLLVEKNGKSTEITAKHVIVATGARARAFPGMEVDNKVVITYKQALIPKKTPKKLIIIGSGAIGMEFAYFYHAMGSEVIIIEAAPQILPLEDHEISKVVDRSFKKNGIKMVTNAMVSSAKAVKNKAVVSYEIKGEETSVDGDMCLVAVGVLGNTDAIGAEHTQMKVERNTIDVDDYYRTDHPGVYAIGDVIGAPALAHVASHEGIVCIEAIADLNPHPIDYGNVPGCTYCQPQIGSCGKTEKQCKEEDIPIKIGHMNYATNGKALGLGETEGMVKTIFHAETGELLGAHIVGAEATELIVALQLARTLETTETELIHHMFPHPTLSEMIHESVLDSENRAIHI